MNRCLWCACTLLISLVFPIGCASIAVRHIAESHVEGNAPKDADFDSNLRRDLTKYFEATSGKGVTVQYEFLRRGPTQAGIGFPKYYLWVKVTCDSKVIEEGAVRCAAIAKTHFEVTHFMAKPSLISDLGPAKNVFPAAVCERIAERAKG